MKKLIGLIAIAAIAASMAYGDSVRTWNGDDAGVALRVKNSGNEAVGVMVGTFTIVVTNGSAGAQSLSLGTYTTMATLAAAIEACTNNSGIKTLTVDQNCCLADDAATNFITGAVTIGANEHQYKTLLKWDSSAVVHFDTYYPGASKGGVGDIKTLSKVFGDLRGTGDITIVGYVDRTEVYSKYITSPVYLLGQYFMDAATSTNVSDNVTPGEINLDLNIGIGRDESILCC